jgi:hypothetical protein
VNYSLQSADAQCPVVPVRRTKVELPAGLLHHLGQRLGAQKETVRAA